MRLTPELWQEAERIAKENNVDPNYVVLLWSTPTYCRYCGCLTTHADNCPRPRS